MGALVEYVAHHARLDAPAGGNGGNGGASSARAHLSRALERARESGASSSRAGAARIARLEAQLAGPERPDALRYLLDWHHELHGRSGVGMDGFVPLTFTTIAAWAQLTERAPLPHEVAALLTLDTVRRNPPPEAEETDDG